MNNRREEEELNETTRLVVVKLPSPLVLPFMNKKSNKHLTNNNNDNDSAGKSRHQMVPWWLAVIWISGLCFGTFALWHYVLAYFHVFPTTESTQHAWDRTDPNLHRSSTAANCLMVIHLLGGCMLMALGPIQFLPHLRRQQHIGIHRWMGRIYLLAALVAAGGATFWTLIWHTSRCNIHEDIGNLLLGGSTLICASQTYFQIAILQNRRGHALWAWRMYASLLGAPLYRLYVTVYGGLVLYTPWEGSLRVENTLFYLIVFPNLLVVEWIWWKREQQQKITQKPPQQPDRQASEDSEREDTEDGVSATTTTTITQGRVVAAAATAQSSPSSSSPLPVLFLPPVWMIQVAIGFVVVTTTLIVAVQWLPALLGADTGVTTSFYHDFCPAG